jgi:hypothetical protein
VRRGIDDVRLLTELYSVIRQLKDRDATDRRPGQVDAAIRAAVLSLTERAPAPEVEAIRQRVLDSLVRLRSILDS